VSLVPAELMRLQRPYWVPVSCLSIMQGASLRLVWKRHAQHLVGTAAGLGLAWLLLALPLDTWEVVAAMLVLAVIIESLVLRHYGLAVVFITPLTIYLAEATHWHSSLRRPPWRRMRWISRWAVRSAWPAVRRCMCPAFARAWRARSGRCCRPGPERKRCTGGAFLAATHDACRSPWVHTHL